MAPRKKTTKAKGNGTTAAAIPSEGAPFEISMTDDEVNAYLASVARNEVKLAGMEADVAKKFRATSHQSQQVGQAVQEMAQRLEQGRTQQQQLAGELKGYATLLISAEDSRRKAATPKKRASAEEPKQPEAGAEAG